LGGCGPVVMRKPGLISGEARPRDRPRPCRSNHAGALFGHRQRPRGPPHHHLWMPGGTRALRKPHRAFCAPGGVMRRLPVLAGRAAAGPGIPGAACSLDPVERVR
jgi:hypothetical protein